MKNFTKVINPYVVRGFSRMGREVDAEVFVKIEFKDGRLSLCGVEGPTRSGDCYGSCGQISRNSNPVRLNEGWSPALVEALFAAWSRWHLNDMRAGCEHQRELGWKSCPGHYGVDAAPCEGGRALTEAAKIKLGNGRYSSPTLNSWRCSADKVGHPCPQCGFCYGTAWLREEVPDAVLEFLVGLPDSTVTPAWV
jgi:hypothetical protein